MGLSEKMRRLSDKKWLSLLIKSISKPTIKSVEFPGFPSPTLQANFVGSSNGAALREGFHFYSFVKRNAQKAGIPLQTGHKLLDFGCGWGRHLRFFWKDIAEENLHGCDVRSDVLDVCRETRVPGNFSLITPDGTLPYPDGHFNVIVAYSVFTHLPEDMNLHWMKELARVAAPGCLFCLTIEPRRFLDFVAAISDRDESVWHRTLARFNIELARYYAQFDAGEIAYLPTGGGGVLKNSVYGDAVVPLAFIEKNWSPYFEVKEYIDDEGQFWQAVLAVQRTAVAIKTAGCP